MTEDHLLERLIDEAARRGRTEADRDRALKTAEEAAGVIANERDLFFIAETQLKVSEKRAAELRDEIHKSRNCALMLILCNLHQAVEIVVFGSPKRRPRGNSPEMENLRLALAAAKERIDDEIPF